MRAAAGAPTGHSSRHGARSRRGTVARVLGPALAAAIVLIAMPLRLATPSASAAPCPDVEVVFARGTVEQPGGIGYTGLSFIEALRAQSGGKSISSYGVDYAASADFGNRQAFAHSVLDGIRDAQARIRSTAATCPGTRIVLGGYSQGAALTGFAVTDGVPAGVPAEYAQSVPAPMPAEIADHVAAIVLFGKPSDRWMRDLGLPAIGFGPGYRDKVVDYCIPGDTICDGAPVGQPNALHALYSMNGMTLAAAANVRHRL